jgi:MYXO-CTERM domain-containing protein
LAGQVSRSDARKTPTPRCCRSSAARAKTFAPVIAGLGLVGVATALAMARRRGSGTIRSALIAFA